MQLSHEAITSFQKLYQKKCGVWLDYEEAQVMALKELKRFALIYKPIPIEDQDILNQLSNEN
ncbi:MAG: hypothetical protein PVJ09_04070 [Candidatus Woesebacteria bacterium]|jgi:hypothetical protein